MIDKVFLELINEHSFDVITLQEASGTSINKLLTPHYEEIALDATLIGNVIYFKFDYCCNIFTLSPN
jgi:hypothetical protein